MIPDLTARAVGARELMDEPDADQAMLDRTYALFPLVNAVVSGWRGVYRRDIRPLARRRRLRVLDIGAGGGDLTRLIARRLHRDGCDAQVTGLDVDPRAVRWASAQDGPPGLRWRCASTSDLVAEGEVFDLVISNHVLHHLTPGLLSDVLSDSLRLRAPGGAVLHGDIARSRTAYALFAAATLPLARTVLAGSFIRPDGLTSIRRSFTADELAVAAGDGWSVEQRMPSRLLLRARDLHPEKSDA
ncbi:2-polyprenyl-3-methyl-5-hydroxy-6-metoxy-1,4-benzoquinol methylase [Microbacterium sp. W4I4]|uniref:methyltransferase domain-containing protein n=1 Tax=Microbacterium sp. W4I4 TaxID=3042295 RepID=UPI0027806705|nr:methyltransferase domain-containing protein [Microbacterium sp. W4I4]MDQ0612431.1 2-polyprenyl-3-methyl-5-hydroxy-6-metoxy-1,4-benzoquinol methylase [Microbacterium sp. W4I4]